MSPRRTLSLLFAGTSVFSIAALAVTVPAVAGRGPEAQTPVTKAHSQPPRVTHTGKGPTGYTVTFQFEDPGATRVQIKGEWYFANTSTISAPASTPTTVPTTPGTLPAQWSTGDFPIASPNSTAANWPVADLVKDKRTGIWSYTIPLPSGTFTYGYYVNCTSATQTGCTQIADPSNPAWNVNAGGNAGSAEASSQVYVPSDPRFGTVDNSWQASSPTKGRIVDVTYASPGHLTPAGVNYLAIYTPPGYDPKRATPYPTLYLSHGGGGNEVDWTTQGAAAAILDNLIKTGQIQPMVVVMPNAGGYPDSVNYAAYDTDLLTNMIPYVESRYHVSTAASDRAFSGLSMGGAITASLMTGHTDQFGSYGLMSGGMPATTTALSSAQATALKKTNIFVGGGWQDPVHAAGYMGRTTGTIQVVSLLANAGVPSTPDFVNGGHEWYVWRVLLKDFLTRVAFLPPVAG